MGKLIRRSQGKYNNIILSIIALILILTVNPAYASETSASKTGEKLGYEAGKKVGIENAATFPRVKVEDILPEDAEIELENSNILLGKEPEYVDEFVSAYIKGFKAGYKESQVKVNYGANLGYAYGEIQAYNDRQKDKKFDLERDMPSKKELIKKFDLNLETPEYQNNFISSYIEGYQLGYADTYESELFGEFILSVEQGEKNGDKFGKLIGEMHGTSDYFNNEDFDVNRNIPTDKEIISDFALNRELEDYTNSLILNFKRAYKEAYSEAFRNLSVNTKLDATKTAYDNGVDIGTIEGDLSANSDYILGKPSNWETNKVKDMDILVDYELTIQSEQFQKDFISGYWKGFSTGYISTYNELIQGASQVKTHTEIVQLKGATITSKDNSFALVIPQGTLYNDTLVNIRSSNNIKGFGSTQALAEHSNITGLIPSSKYYEVSIQNKTNLINNKYPIEVAFEYYGDNTAGIYKLVNDKWTYIPSKISNGVISATLKPSNIKTSHYVVLIDENWKNLYDTRGHWAKEEIDTYVRRKILTGYPDGTFKPKNAITRQEFLIVLSRIHNWDISNPYGINYGTNNYNFGNLVNTPTNFSDSNKFKNNIQLVNYAVTRGYVKGYEDGTFKPNNSITYKEVEIIMQRITNNKNFKWSEIAEKMKYEESFRSPSYDSMKNTITRAEVIYMLYDIYEGDI